MEQDTGMVQAANIIQAPAPKKKRKSKALLLDLVNNEHERDNAMAKTENEDLNLHVTLCEQRYKSLESRLEALDERLTSLEAKVANLKSEMLTGFSDIKLLIEKQNNQRSTQIIASAGAVIAAIFTAAAYILTR